MGHVEEAGDAADEVLLEGGLLGVGESDEPHQLDESLLLLGREPLVDEARELVERGRGVRLGLGEADQLLGVGQGEAERPLERGADDGPFLVPDLGVGAHHFDEERRGREPETMVRVARGYRGITGDMFLEEPLERVEHGESVSPPAGFVQTVDVGSWLGRDPLEVAIWDTPRMKTIGLLGGMSWESTVPYYTTLNRLVAERLGGLHSAKILLSSVDFAPLEALMRAGDWDEIGRLLAHEAVVLEEAGAGVLLLCTNTMHKVAETLESAVRIPLLHIADVTGAAVRGAGLERVGLLGTRFTMAEDFYAARLARLGIDVLTPPADERALVDRVIFQELCRGQLLDSSRAAYVQVMRDLVTRGADGIVLACTEIGLLLGDAPFPVPLFDTAVLHARAAADLALA